ncbi:hypothetical protein HDU83_009247 [Entophlyctis luteolus]|nr:hypothetical protein HDU83_009247 [Entophlyctis luteolus]
MAQSVIDELENLDLDGAIKKKSTDDDGFDYVYHLPHADLSRLPPRTYDPFAQFAIVEPEKNNQQLKIDLARKNIPVIATADSRSSLGKQAAKLLGFGADQASNDARTKRLHVNHRGSKDRLGIGLGSQYLAGGSRMALSVSGGASSPGDTGARPSFVTRRTSHASTMAGDSHSVSKASMNIGSGLGLNRRSMTSKKVAPYGESSESVDFARPEFSDQSLRIDGISYMGSSEGNMNNALYDDDEYNGIPSFKAVPDSITKYVSAKFIAIICFCMITSLTLAVILYDFIELGFGKDVVDS